jgi:hypothetical protein
VVFESFSNNIIRANHDFEEGGKEFDVDNGDLQSTSGVKTLHSSEEMTILVEDGYITLALALRKFEVIVLC